MKERIRKELMRIRNDLSELEVLEKSKQIKKRLFAMDKFEQASTILFYVSYDNEVYTHDMIKEGISNRKNVIVPISDKENRRLILSQLNNWNSLESGSYGILEPRKEQIKEISIDKVDLVIVPGVGFDKRGYRIGHGKGYYDGLLRNSKNVLHIGLAFELQIADRIPTEDHDLPVHKIITEKRIIECRKTK